MTQYISTSEKETRKIAQQLGRKIKTGVIALKGELGAGKTIFAQGFAKGLRIKEKIISPTFVLIRQHKIPQTEKIFYHIDLYRIEKPKSLQELGIDEILSNPNNIILIEWAEKLKKLPKDAIKISITKKGSHTRLITIS